jgi:acetolactate synthase-1/2/3 large subunit
MPTVVHLVVDGLIKAEVARLFAVCGGGPVAEALEAAARTQGLSVVRCHGDAAAVTMAAVTGELTGRPGAACSALGPGVTSSATGLAHAFLDRSPVIYVSGRHSDTTLAFVTRQVVDHAALVAPVAKASLTLGVDSVSHWMAHAAQLALKEPRGPVHLDLPADLVSLPALPLAASARPPSDAPPDAALLDRAAAMIRAARRPVVVAGLACRPGDANWLRAFCEAVPAPALTTPKAKGAVPDPHPLAMGGFTGGSLEEPVVGRADLIIAFGLDPVELLPRPWPYRAPVLSLARCPSTELPARGARHFTPALEVVGDLALILEELAPRLVRGDARPDWDVAEIDRLRRERRAALQAPTAGLAPHRVVQLSRELTPAGAIACIDRGAHAPVATAYWDAVEPGECLISNGLAAPGFAVPAAIAAQLVHPGRRVVCFTDVAGLLATAAELDTAAGLGLPVAIVVLDARPLERPDALRSPDPTTPGRRGPDVARLAQALGAAAFSALDEAAFERAFVQALAARGPSVIDARVDASAFERLP